MKKNHWNHHWSCCESSPVFIQISWSPWIVPTLLREKVGKSLHNVKDWRLQNLSLHSIWILIKGTLVKSECFFIPRTFLNKVILAKVFFVPLNGNRLISSAGGTASWHSLLSDSRRMCCYRNWHFITTHVRPVTEMFVLHLHQQFPLPDL